MQSLSAFIITYKRVDIAKNTIQDYFQQSVIPDKLIIIDNDPDQSAQVLIDHLPHLPLEYHSMGFNAGPAGAAAAGLRILSGAGYNYILWIDDDDPPYFEDVVERLIQVMDTHPDCGCTGVVGQYFNLKSGLIRRVPNVELEGEGSIEVQNIAGNMIKLVNGDLIRKHTIVPEEKLFFGFEELDFDLQIQKTGYRLWVEKDLYRKHRQLHNRTGWAVQRGKRKSEALMKRDYYSSRNLLRILYREKLIQAFISTLFRIVYKSITGFRYGPTYGMKHLWYQFMATLHFLLNRYGKTF